MLLPWSNRNKLFVIAVIFIGLLLVLVSQKSSIASGYVVNEKDVAVNAIVREKTTSYTATTDNTGYFELEDLSNSIVKRITAWADGYYIGGINVYPWTKQPVTIQVNSYPVEDNPDYVWLPPEVSSRTKFEDTLIHARLSIAAFVSVDHVFFPLSEKLELGCKDCHAEIYSQWKSSTHSLGNQNIIFMTMYNGTDVLGNQSPLAKFFYHKDYGRVPIAPEINENYFGPGYKLDFPSSTGNCATCHLPGAALSKPFSTDPNQIEGINTEGSHCDFCHKISNVILDTKTGLLQENYTGVLSLKFLRPSENEQIFFGPLDDVDAGSDTYLPLIQQSEYCAACHDAKFWGTPIYESFSEWQKSSFNGAGITCQDCHMKPNNLMINFAPRRGGQVRDSKKLSLHSFPGGLDEDLLENTALMNVGVHEIAGTLVVDVAVENIGAGHHIPTDSPLRQIFLIVEATDEAGQNIALVSGPVLPDWAGDLENVPGKYYAKLLQQLWIDDFPSPAYWNPTIIKEDTRIPAGETDLSTFQFDLEGIARAYIRVQLIYRRAYFDLMEQKGWKLPDIIMEEKEMTFVINE